MDLDEFPDEEWVDEESDSDDDLLVCPSCNQAVHEDTQQCPHCGDYITPIWPNQQSKRLIWAIAAIMVIVAMLMMIAW